ncbi:MAG: MFS transporter [Clostridia bacterium]|nr:MFS transporter [Oscillospiraceae bacterium]MBQ7006014.1 MFS transporter [Clostridia bacterium]
MKDNKTPPFGIKDKLGYLFGDFGNDFTFLFSSSFLMKFYTDVIGVSAGVVGVIMMSARIIDAFTDVAMGRICDKSPLSARGKFRPWIIRMCVPVAVSSFLMYIPAVANLPYTLRVLYLFITYILWGSFFYTSVNIPYGSMASAISPESGDRQSLSTFRTIGGMLAGAIITAGVPLFAFIKDPSLGIDVIAPYRFSVTAGVFSILAVVCYLLCYFLTTERVRSKTVGEAQNSNNVFTMLKNAASNRALISIIAASVVMLLSQLTMQQMSNYVFPVTYGNAKMISLSTVIMLFGMAVAAALAKPLSERFGKAEVSVVSNLFAGIINLILFFIRPSSVYVYIVFQAVSWIGLGIFAMVNWALITDVIDYSEIKNGVREDGSVYALYSFARKLGQAASSGVSGALLTLIGYNPDNITSGVKSGIFNIATLVPAIGLILLAAILWFWYPLHKKQVEENIRILKEKHKD